ncbi:MAG: hypothetical protein LAT76_00370 [Schleiferiaceae bacterium]|nr:hypothetical protein [Schleiferiaceae bacterium]
MSKTSISSLNPIFLPFEDFHQALKALVHADNEILLNEVGASELQRPIFELTIGKGAKKVFIWSQMHGNEASGTRGLLLWLQRREYAQFTNVYTIVILPMLNPDGATAFTRRNAHGIDINRDARKRQTAEMRLLQSRILFHKPELALNLHDQRSIFGVGDSKEPAALSFLAPSRSPEKEVTKDRIAAMRVIAAIVAQLPNHFHSKVGRYNDDFYPTAIGEWVQQQGIPCVLVEAGVLDASDYGRNAAVSAHPYIFNAALEALQNIESAPNESEYFAIPENKESFVDLIITNAVLNGKPTTIDLGFTKTFQLDNDQINVFWVLNEVGDLQFKTAYRCLDKGEVSVEVTELLPLINSRVDIIY